MNHNAPRLSPREITGSQERLAEGDCSTGATGAIAEVVGTDSK